MKKNGFTLVELIVSIVMISFIGILFFYMIISFKNKLSEVNIKSDVLLYNATVMKVVYDDMINNEIVSVKKDGNTVTYTYLDGGTNINRSLSFAKKYILYNDVKYPVPDNCEIVESEYSNLLDDEKTTDYNNVFSLNLTLDCHVLDESYNINFTSIY